MKQTLFLSAVTLVLGCSFPVFAEQRSVEEVMEIAGEYLSNPQMSALASVRHRLSSANENLERDAFYIVRNEENKPGFVIVSADDRMPRVLAWSDNSFFPEGELPEHVRSVLSSYNNSLRAVDEGWLTPDEAFPLLVLSSSSVADEVEVGPLLGDINFDQSYPYNYYTPTVSGKKCPAGCVATAMAQIMRYFGYPACGKGTYPVSTPSGAKSVVLEDLPFDWNNILKDYSKQEYDEVQAEAVGRLLYACGASVNMNYKPDGSGAQGTKMMEAMRDAFAYNRNAELRQVPNSFTPAEVIPSWVPQIMEHLRKALPVYFDGGASLSAGHAFVIDGYRAPNATTTAVGDVLFHLNWGWSGLANGWYYLNNLTPESDKTMSDEMYQNFSQSRCSWSQNMFPNNWTGLDDMDDLNSLPRNVQDGNIYNILGVQINASDLLPNTIYFQNGKKFMFR